MFAENTHSDALNNSAQTPGVNAYARQIDFRRLLEIRVRWYLERAKELQRLSACLPAELPPDVRTQLRTN